MSLHHLCTHYAIQVGTSIDNACTHSSFLQKIKLQLVSCFRFHSFMTGLLTFPHLWMHSVPSNSVSRVYTNFRRFRTVQLVSSWNFLGVCRTDHMTPHLLTLHCHCTGFQSVVVSDTKFLLFAFVTCAITSAGLVFLKIHSGSIALSIQYKCKHVCLPLVPGNFGVLQTAVFLALHRSVNASSCCEHSFSDSIVQRSWTHF